MTDSEAGVVARGLERRDLTHFLLRRLHSLTGVMPIGVFLLEHFYSNYQAVGSGGARRFDELVRDLQSNPLIVYAEIVFIALPILYHAFYGLFIARQARSNVASYGYARNWMFLLQRLSGVLLVAYIGYHVWMTRLRPEFAPELFRDSGGLVTWQYMNHYLTEVHLGLPVWILYVVGTTASVFHFANGLWGFLIHWGITVGPRAQRISGYACTAIGITLLALGLNALYAFVVPSGAGVGLSLVP